MPGIENGRLPAALLMLNSLGSSVRPMGKDLTPVTIPQLTDIAGAESATRKIEAISARIQDAASRPLSRAVTFPPAAYTDEDYFAFEAKRVLETGWMCVAHVSQLKEPGSYIAVDLLGEPLVVTRDA